MKLTIYHSFIINYFFIGTLFESSSEGILHPTLAILATHADSLEVSPTKTTTNITVLSKSSYLEIHGSPTILNSYTTLNQIPTPINSKYPIISTQRFITNSATVPLKTSIFPPPLDSSEISSKYYHNKHSLLMFHA